MRFTEHAPEHGEALAQFNERLKAGGERVQFPVSPVPVWLPPGPGRSIYREHFLALDEDGTVHGAYILKHQDFKIGEKTASVGNLQLPISEGAVNRDYANLAGRFLLDARGRTPLLYCLGMGGRDAALARLFAAAGWTMFAVPFFFRVNHPFPFLRKLTLLRSSLARRLALDLLAFSGLGWLGVKAIQRARRRRVAPTPNLTVEPVDEWDAWADALWAACSGEYGMIAIRSAEILRILYPDGDARFLRLRIREEGKPIGWSVVLDTQMAGHRQFGSLRVGSFVDGLASAADAAKVVRASTRYLEQRGVDLAVSNQSHAGWWRGLRRGGLPPRPLQLHLRRLQGTRQIVADFRSVERWDLPEPR